jgi:hypothetical protein
MTTPDALDYHRAADRVGRIMAALGALGTALALGMRGWPWGAGFFLGALVSILNYRWLRRMVDGLGPERPDGLAPERPRRRRGGVFLALRYLLLGAAAYVIVRFTSVSLPAVFAGVFVLTAAIMIEAVIEIVYARK